MIHRVVIWVPVVLVFAVTSAVFLAARAPRTWAANWSVPRAVARGASEEEYGAVYSPGGWDILSVDDDRHALVLSRAGSGRAAVLDHGDITQPALLRAGSREVAVWVHNYNGSTDLMAATIGTRGTLTRFRLARGPWPIEHPYLFAGPNGTIDLVFSWQRYGNFDVFLFSLRPGATRPLFTRRLTRARIYAFYPRAVLDRTGHIFLLYLDLCCEGHIWHVSLDRYDATGRHRRGQTLAALGGAGTPAQWAEDLRIDPVGRVWGAYAGDTGIWVFRLAGNTPIVESKRLLDPLQGEPASLALALGSRENYLLWEQPFDLGTYLASQRFNSSLRQVSAPERAVYEAAGQTGIHATWQAGRISVLWQAITPSLRSTFETATSTGSRRPDLAQRFGLGLGNPWEALAVLVVVATGVAALTTTGNVLTILIFSMAGLVVMRVLGGIPGRWTIFGIALSAALAATFVAPGGPILFLATLPAMGFAPAPFGILAVAAVFALLLWLSDVALRRVEDLFRIGLLIVAGVYFFAFIEAIVFVQQRLGYI